MDGGEGGRGLVWGRVYWGDLNSKKYNSDQYHGAAILLFSSIQNQ